MPDAQQPDPAHTVAAPPSVSSADATAAGTNRATNSEFNLGAPAAPGELGVLGPYRVVKELGKGGMGAVYLAIDTRLDRELALKVMLPAFAADPAAKERFLREAKAVAKVAHDHVVTVFEADERDGVPYIAMQFLHGYPLDEFLKRKGSPPLSHCVRIVREAALGLAAAHARGLVHRDIKPANLWLEAPNGRVKVLDFGLAKPLGSDSELTKSGAVVGTPAYMSPEQARGQKVDARTDIFSLGAVLYRLLTGRNPFLGDHIMAVLTALAVEDPTPVRELNPNVPQPLADLVHQLLAKKPEARPQSAAEVAERLRTVLSQPAANPNVSASVPVMVQPLPVPMIVTAPESAFANLHDDDDEADRTEREAEPVREPASAPERGKGLLIAGGALVLVAVVSVAIALGTGGKKPDDVAKQPNPSDPSKGKEKPQPKKVDELPKWTPPKAIPVGESPFDKLDPNAIPKDERFDWQPKELVGVIGTHARRHWGGVQAVAVSEDGTKAATVGHEPNSSAFPEVIIWDTATQKPIRRFHLREAYAERVQFAEKASRLYLFGRPSIQLWDIAADPPKPVAIPEPPIYVARSSGWLLEGGKTYCALDNDGSLDLALFSLDGKGNPDGERRKIKKSSFQSCLVASQTNAVIYPTPENRLRRARVKDAKFVDEEELPIKLLPNDFPRGLTDDGKELVVADDKGLGFWDISVKPPVERRRISQTLLSGEDRVSYSPCGRWLVVQGVAGTSLWRKDGAELKLIARLETNNTHFGKASFSGDGNTLVVGNTEGFVRFWDLRGPEPKELSPFDPATGFGAGDQHFAKVRLSPKSGTVLLPRFDRDELKGGRWQLWAFDGPTPRAVLGANEFLHGETDRHTCWWPTGDRWLFSQLGGGWSAGLEARTYRVTDGHWRSDGEPFGDKRPCGMVTPDGKLFLALAGEGNLTIDGWDMIDKPTKQWSVPHPAKSDLTREWAGNRVTATSHDGSRFAVHTISEGRKADVRIWQHSGAKPLLQETIIRHGCQWGWYIAAMSPDGGFYAHSQRTNTTEPEVLDITGKESRKVGQLPNLLGVVHWLAYSPDGRNLAAAGDKGVAVFDAKTLQPVWTWDTSPGPVHWLDWAADGCHLVTHNGNKTLYVLRLDLSNTRVPLTLAGTTEWSKLWVARGEQSWKLQDGRLMNGNSGRGWIGTRTEYTDFELELEYKLGAMGNSGIFLRAWADGELSGSQFVEVQLIDDAGYKVTGLTGTGAVFKRVPPNPAPVTKLNEWNAAVVRVVGKRVTVTINGTKCVDSDVEFPRAKGVIGLQQLDSPVEFRNVRVRDLTQVAANPDRAAAEWALSVGGTVSVSTKDTVTRVHPGERLPGEPFQLKTVALDGSTGATDDGLARVAGLPALTHLYLDKTPVSDAGLVHLKGLKALIDLKLNGTAGSDAGLVHLAGLTDLQAVHLYGLAGVTDAGLAHLSGLGQLRFVDLRETKVTAKGVAGLAKALPACRIRWDGGTIEPSTK